MPASRATLPQVAERAGVSLSSASRALHGSGASPAMVDRVRAAAAELGYIPDATARSLRLGRTFQIAFAVADIGNPVYVEMMSAIQRTVGHAYRLVVTPSGDTIDSTIELLDHLNHRFVDGVIISPLRVDDLLVERLRDAAVPVVVVGRALEAEQLNSVSTDSGAGIAQAVEHLLGIGRRRIGFLNGPTDTTPGSARQHGFLRAVQQQGLADADVDTQVAENFTVTAGVEAARDLISRHAGGRAPLDAIVAANDLLAIGAINAAREHGLSVPEDLAVTGMDDTEIGRVFQPSLTSVSLRSAERGRIAARILLDLLDDPSRPAQTAFVQPTLITRESTGQTPADEVPADETPRHEAPLKKERA